MERWTYVAMGDSAGVGVGAHDGRGYVDRVYERLEAVAPRAALLNLCRSGATSDAVRSEHVGRAVAARPAVVTLFIGGNDLWRGVSPRRYGENLDAIVDALGATGARMILGTVPDLAHAPAAVLAEQFLGITPATLESRAQALSDEVRRVAAARGCDLLDLHAVGLSDRPHFFSADGFHPSSEGYAHWADQLWPLLRRALTRGGRAG
ncbi:MAG: SGNH/GDSL hydrolase family protein [Deltaproteobacteria bacterium]|nr:SGNH/GDSL hydrolase family protein [Myxococcales bacterium]MDP3215653.1 SGNH/GDSL hydrolase family protein [Deltaproteobacteria bacterium]